MKRLRIAVVGLGKMGLVHTSILNVIPNVQVVALCEKNSLLLKFVGKLFKKAQAVDDLHKLAGLDLDSVHVTTSIPSHFPVVKDIYLAKVTRNIFVEKTLASSWEEASELCRLAKSYGNVNMVGYMKRFAVTFQTARNMLSQGILGELTSFDAYAYSSDFYGTNKGGKMHASRGGALSDLGSHIIDLALWFFGDLEVYSATLESMFEGKHEDSARFMVKKSDLEGQFHVSWLMDNYRMPYFGLEIRGSKGVMKVNDDTVEMKLNDRKSTKWYRQDLNDNVNFLLGEREYCREDEYFVNTLLTDNKAEPSFETASKVDYLINRVKRKASNNV